jgi:non-specific serine/threonine protein kinase/serine/threonine-protein kinase
MSGLDRERLARLFEQAIDLPEPERDEFIDRVCGNEPPLREELLALLEADRHAENASTERIARPLARFARAAQAREEASGDEALPERIGPFRVLRLLGRGGMAQVYLAAQSEPLKRQVALKLLRPGLDSKEVLARFEAERQALAQMSHPNVARAFDAGVSEDGRPYFVMEAIDGLPVTQFADRERLDLRARIELFLEICEGVDHAHRKGLIHRDVKPSNVLVTSEDGRPRPKIIDFGIAKSIDVDLIDDPARTREGALLGTPAYMSPEQASFGDRNVDTRSDIYSLGVLLYELLAGVLPFSTPEEVVPSIALRERILRIDAPTPSARIVSLGDEADPIASRRRSDPRSLRQGLRGDLDWILTKTLEKDPERRYASAHELAADLRRHLRAEPVQAGPPSLSYRLRKMVRRHKAGTAMAAAVLMALVVSLGSLAHIARVESRERTLAEAESRKAERVLDLFQGLLLRAAEKNAEGDPLTVVEALDEASARIGGILEGQPVVKASILEAIGRGYLFLEEFEPAAKTVDRGLEVLADSAPEDRLGGNDVHLELLRTQARLLFRGGRLDESEKVLRRLLVHPASTPVDRADDLNLLGLLLRSRGRLHEARESFEEALALYREHAAEFDRTNLETARGLGLKNSGFEQTIATISENLAQILFVQGDVAGAEGRVRRALEIRADVDPSGTGVATSTYNLAWILRAQGRHRDALPLAEEAVRLERLTERRTFLSNALVMRGEILSSLGRHTEAERSVREAVSLVVDVHGNEHRGALSKRIVLGRLLVSAGRAEEALALADELVRTADAQQPPLHLIAMRAELMRAAAHESLQRPGQALEATRAACRRAREADTRVQPFTPHLQLAERLTERGELDEAESVARALLASLEARDARTSVLLSVRAVFVDIALARGKKQEATRLARELRQEEIARPGSVPTTRCAATWRLARCLIQQADAAALEEAQALLQRELGGPAQILGTEHETVAEGRRLLARLHAAERGLARASSR